MFRKCLAPLAALAVVVPVAAQQPEGLDSTLLARIRAEEADHSQLMNFVHYIADDYGPRPIGSPNQVAAAQWAVRTMTAFGMKNAHLEPFTWNGIGWLPGPAYGYMTAPVTANFKLESAVWSPSTKGVLRGPMVSVVGPENPTEAELTAYMVSMAPKVKGGIVMVGPPPDVPVNFNPRPMRYTDEELAQRYDSGGAGGRGGRGPFGGGRGRGRGNVEPTPPGHLSPAEVNERLQAFVRDNQPGLLLIPQGGGRIPGVIVAQNRGGQIYNDTTPQPPTIILRNDDYGRIYRIIHDGTPVSVVFSMTNHYYHTDTSYVTVAEIPGTEHPEQVVMMGGHLDSWTSATGATDNGVNCATMMEAARIIEALGIKPKRTIRVALWSGEEQGLLGSFAYVRNHFGSAEDPKPEFKNLDAYWNIDDGTGQVRGATIMGPPAAAAIVGDYLRQFRDWGVYGALPSTARVEGGSDNGAFAVAGLPGIGAQQDPISYNSTTWHTDLDDYDQLVPQDVERNAAITAALMLGLADRDEMLPRFPADSMPAVPAAGARFRGRGGTGPSGPVAIPHVFMATKGVPLSVRGPGIDPTPGRGETAPSTVKVAAAPAHGRLTLQANGSFVYTPAAGYVGTDTFSYIVTRNDSTSAPGKVTVIVH
jgi:carboxypeptidase Q